MERALKATQDELVIADRERRAAYAALGQATARAEKQRGVIMARKRQITRLQRQLREAEARAEAREAELIGLMNELRDQLAAARAAQTVVPAPGDLWHGVTFTAAPCAECGVTGPFHQPGCSQPSGSFVP